MGKHAEDTLIYRGELPDIFDPENQPIVIEEDLWNDKSPNVVPLETDLSQIPQHSRMYTDKNIDDDCYSKFEDKEELKYYTPHRLDKSKMTTIRHFDAAERECQRILDEINKAAERDIFIGFDTERNGFTFQISVKFLKKDGKIFERNVLFQMQTGKNKLITFLGELFQSF